MVTKTSTQERFISEFGKPDRSTLKVVAWEFGSSSAVLQVDQPNREEAAFVWLPCPQDGSSIPEIALQYPGESGRHSGTYASLGLERGKPALKLIVRTEDELASTIAYINAIRKQQPRPTILASSAEKIEATRIDTSIMPAAPLPKPRREAIPRAVQREVWQRDGGRCVECSSKERLCFDHIVPFSRGGANTVRNLQLLCEQCNLSKGNRL